MREDHRLYQIMKGWEKEVFQKEEFLEAIDQIQQEAFMEGYRYAIKVLKEGMVKKEEK